MLHGGQVQVSGTRYLAPGAWDPPNSPISNLNKALYKAGMHFSGPGTPPNGAVSSHLQNRAVVLRLCLWTFGLDKFVGGLLYDVEPYLTGHP